MSNESIGIVRIYYEQLWNTHVILDEWKLQAMNEARKIWAGKEAYQAACCEVNSTMPWFFTGILHMMECSCSFEQHLHNGDPLTARTVQVPKGRPLKGAPTFTWHESAVDALRYEGFDKFQNWSLSDILYRFEKYNGLGYRNRGILSPYLWCGTNHYTKGKYDADNHFNPELKSDQVGAAVLLRFVTDKTLGIAQ